MEKKYAVFIVSYHVLRSYSTYSLPPYYYYYYVPCWYLAVIKPPGPIKPDDQQPSFTTIPRGSTGILYMYLINNSSTNAVSLDPTRKGVLTKAS